jgi:hypothetical protein
MKPTIKFQVNKGTFKKGLIDSMSKLNDANTFKRELQTANGKNLFQEFDKLKKDMVADFLRHPITKEIENGPMSSNISGTLGGYGNLFSFIGFEKSSRPISPIVELLNQTNFSCSRMVRGMINITVELPSAEQIFRATPLPWAPGLSWAQRIEVGMSGLGMYMSKLSPKSRSTTGVQTDSVIRSGKFTNTKYITSFLKKWVKEFVKLTGGRVVDI